MNTSVYSQEFICHPDFGSLPGTYIGYSKNVIPKSAIRAWEGTSRLCLSYEEESSSYLANWDIDNEREEINSFEKLVQNTEKYFHLSRYLPALVLRDCGLSISEEISDFLNIYFYLLSEEMKDSILRIPIDHQPVINYLLKKTTEKRDNLKKILIWGDHKNYRNPAIISIEALPLVNQSKRLEYAELLFFLIQDYWNKDNDVCRWVNSLTMGKLWFAAMIPTTYGLLQKLRSLPNLMGGKTHQAKQKSKLADALLKPEKYDMIWPKCLKPLNALMFTGSQLSQQNIYYAKRQRNGSSSAFYNFIRNIRKQSTEQKQPSSFDISVDHDGAIQLATIKRKRIPKQPEILSDLKPRTKNKGFQQLN